MTSWATKRKTVLVIVLVSLIIAFGVLLAIPFVYKVPSCMDGKQNQDESGIDCGGGCARICAVEASAPNVRFARTLSQLGRTDVIAYVDNRNQNAYAKDAQYTVEVYDENRTLIGKQTGVVDLAPSVTTPLFISGIPTGARTAVQAFVSFEAGDVEWYQYDGKVQMPTVREAKLQDGVLPRIIAVLENQTPRPFLNTEAVVTVFDSFNNAIAASKTVVRTVPASGTAEAIFTWPAPFASPAVRVEVLTVPVP
ncbi:hypothetical protein KKH15_00785 [Patescibacteria group bacterium]|nr:hypothetical protein [Patescibacteria group bacterium]MBU1755045.1 hypothetical protein [Patescibacteria group bacterium]